jgi:hypothetical protein
VTRDPDTGRGAGCAFLLFVAALYLGAGIAVGFLIWGR